MINFAVGVIVGLVLYGFRNKTLASDFTSLVAWVKAKVAASTAE